MLPDLCIFHVKNQAIYSYSTVTVSIRSGVSCEEKVSELSCHQLVTAFVQLATYILNSTS